jgi:hypothetical protein
MPCARTAAIRVPAVRRQPRAEAHQCASGGRARTEKNKNKFRLGPPLESDLQTTRNTPILKMTSHVPYEGTIGIYAQVRFVEAGHKEIS